MAKSSRSFERTAQVALPAERAFVVQLRADADLARGVVRGRVEHMLSGAAARFESLEQLVGCMQDALAAAARRSTPPAPIRPAAPARRAKQEEKR